MEDERDSELRRAALDRVQELPRRYDDLAPVAVLRAGFSSAGRRVPLGSFYKAIFRPARMRGPAL
jgi:hypothetical protein